MEGCFSSSTRRSKESLCWVSAGCQVLRGWESMETRVWLLDLESLLERRELGIDFQVLSSRIIGDWF